jgi:hypothetical protein
MPKIGRSVSNSSCGALGEMLDVTDSGPPERITPLGLMVRIASAAFWNGTTSE